MLDLKGRANVAMARWGPGVHQQSIWNYRQQEGRPVSVSGSWDPRFDELADQLECSVADGSDRGASICVVQDGETVADIWHGSADLDATVPWERDTLVPVWSITKVMANLTILVLADRGELDVRAPVARYWPEFAAAGKQDITVAQV